MMRCAVVVMVTVVALVGAMVFPAHAFLFGTRVKSGCAPPWGIVTDAGWVTNAGYTDYSLTAGPGVPGVYYTPTEIEHKYNYSSLYLSAEAFIGLGQKEDGDPGLGRFTVGVFGALPSEWDGDADYDSFLTHAHRLWDADTYWGVADGYWEYPINSSFGAVMGFRWDYWQTSFRNPVNVVPLMFHANTDTAFFTLNSYLPYVGVTSTFRGLRAGVIGFPVYFGEVDYKENFGGSAIFLHGTGNIGEGHFLEAFLEYEIPTDSLISNLNGVVTIFGKFNSIEARSTVSVQQSGIFFPATYDWDFSVRRKLFIVGAKVTWNFEIENLIPFSVLAE